MTGGQSYTSDLTDEKNNAIGADGKDGKGWYHFWDMVFLPICLPFLLGLGMGVFLALLIVKGAWHFVLPLVLVIPGSIILVHYPFASILIWLLAFPFFAASPSVAARYIYWILHRAMVPGTLGILLLSDWLGAKNRKSISLGRAELIMSVFLVWGVFNIILFNSNPLSTLYGFYDQIFVPFCAYWLIRLTAPGENEWKYLLGVFLFAVLAQCVIGLLSWFVPYVIPPYWLRMQGARTTGTLSEPAVYTVALVSFAVPLFQYAMHCKIRWISVSLLFTFALAFFCVFFSFSRGSWLGGIVVLIGLMFRYPRVIIPLSVIGVGVIVILSNTVLSQEIAFAQERLNNEKTAEGRVIQYNAAIQMGLAKPFLGWGYGNYDRYDHQFEERVGNIAYRHENTSHNTYLTIVAEMGFWGFFLYFFPVFWWFRLSIKVWKRLPHVHFWGRALLISLWLPIVHQLIVSSFADIVRFFPFGTTMWWMFIGLIASAIYPYFEPDDFGVPDWTRQLFA